jgi:hypothetical protein
MESNKPPNNQERHMLFLSHATPEDNAFARWLALQLANEGYPVWCDLTKLLGGEDFWKDIQEAIRKRSIRFLFVLSRSSNTKEGTLQELACAKAVAAQVSSEIRDFIIALKIDDLPYSEVDIEIQRLNHISFTGSWASGLNQLLKKLAKDNVPEDPRFNPDSVSSWWAFSIRVQRRARCGGRTRGRTFVSVRANPRLTSADVWQPRRQG